jgi:hypothetical protein
MPCLYYQASEGAYSGLIHGLVTRVQRNLQFPCRFTLANFGSEHYMGVSDWEAGGASGLCFQRPPYFLLPVNAAWGSLWLAVFQPRIARQMVPIFEVVTRFIPSSIRLYVR